MTSEQLGDVLRTLLPNARVTMHAGDAMRAIVSFDLRFDGINNPSDQEHALQIVVDAVVAQTKLAIGDMTVERRERQRIAELLKGAGMLMLGIPAQAAWLLAIGVWIEGGARKPVPGGSEITIR